MSNTITLSCLLEQRKREILVEESNGGEACPAVLTRKRKCRGKEKQCQGKKEGQFWYQGSWR